MSAFTQTGTENKMRWDRSSRSFMEVWYCTLDHRPSGCGLWFRYTLTAPVEAEPYCELWAFVFDPDGKRSFAGKHRYPIDRLGSSNGRDDGALVRIGDAWLSENHLEGHVDSGDRSISWSLDFEPATRCFQHLPAQIRSRIESKVSTVCSPNLSVPFTGTVKLDGDALDFDSERGMQSHRWGRRHSLTWTWAHCSGFDDSDATFEGLAAKAALGPIRPTTTFLYLDYEGMDLEFNQLRWALRAKSRYEMPTWAFTARNEDWKIVGGGRVAPSKLVQVRYSDPDGSERFCANSEIADLAIEIYRRSGGDGWQHHGSLTALGTAHLEFGREQPFAELPVAF